MADTSFATVTAASSVNKGVSDVAFDPSTMIDVVAYGAMHDGKADDSAAIQRAEQEAQATGKILYFEAGTYLLDRSLKIHSGDSLVAAGPGTVLKAAGTASTVIQTEFAPSDDVSLQTPISKISVTGLTFDGNRSLSDPGGADSLVVAWRATGLQFNDCTIENTPRLGALMSDVANSGFYGCTFANVGYAQADLADPSNDSFAQGVAFSADPGYLSTSNYVTQSMFHQIGLDAISATLQTGMAITGNQMFSLDTQPLGFWRQKADGSAGIYLAGDNQIVASSNNISGASGNGIDIVNSSNVKLISNNVTGSGGSGIIFGSTNSINIIGNNIQNNNQITNHYFFQAGVSISDNMWGVATPSSANIDISGNTITDTQAVKTQNWAIQVNIEASPKNVNVNTNNNLIGNVNPENVGQNGVAQAWVQPWNGNVQTAIGTPGEQSWLPTIVSHPPVTASLIYTSVAQAAVAITNGPTLTGDGDPLTIINCTESGKIIGSTTVDSTGRWTFAPSLSDGLHTIEVTETGVPAALGSASVTFTVDRTAPAVSAFLSSSVIHVGADHFVNVSSIMGSGDPNAVVTVTDGGTLVGTSSADASGSWSFTPSLSYENHLLVATETDLAGNVGTASVEFGVPSSVLSGGGGVVGSNLNADAFVISYEGSLPGMQVIADATTAKIDASSILGGGTINQPSTAINSSAPLADVLQYPIPNITYGGPTIQDLSKSQMIRPADIAPIGGGASPLVGSGLQPSYPGSPTSGSSLQGSQLSMAMQHPAIGSHLA